MTDTVTAVRVLQLWRYPIKSVGGQPVESVDVDGAGLTGDRRWALVEGSDGQVGADGELVTARRDPILLAASAGIVDSLLSVQLPDGSVVDTTGDDGRKVSDAFSRLLGRPVRLIDSAGGQRPRPLTEPGPGPPHRYGLPARPGLPDDPAQARISLLGQATVGRWDPRRFRSNLLVSGGGEDGLIGARVGIGSAVLRVNAPVARCVMVTREQPGLPRDPAILRAVNRDRHGTLAVGATVVTAGRIAVGDRVEKR